MQISKKEIIYTINTNGTTEDEQKVRAFRDSLYDDHDDVQMYYNGIHQIKIVASDK